MLHCDASLRYPYSPFVTGMRISPVQSFKITPQIEFGFAGRLCEMYRVETGCGEWALLGGAWAFRADNQIRFGIPPSVVLEFFGLTPETFYLLESTASCANGLSQMFAYVPKKQWNAMPYQVSMFYKEELYA